MSAPPIIHDLVRAFQKDERTYYDNAYSEAQVRISFIDPFLEALGWHPRPDTAYIAEWRDCIVEQSLNVKDEQHKKRADYTCRVGKTPVLIVEAKAPRDDVFTMPTHALQIRRYAHSESLLIGALTNFAQLAIYDGRVPPKHDDGAEIAQLETIRFTEYVEKWDLIESLLSKDAVQRGAQREEVQRRVAKGIFPVDQAILAEISRWREELASDIHRLNTDLNAETLGFAVGRIIDRILFLRVCEARDTEPEGRLKSLLKGLDVYPRLLKLFHLADERYNSGLFYFAEERGRAEKPDLLALRIQVEDKPLKQIISGLYYPQNLKDYSLIPVEILGQVYEQFLGKVVTIPRRGTAKIEDKPAVKKARGVYYTPSYIVNYIVEHTVGKLVEGKTPKQIAKLRVLDPACGSGSFLLGAYQFLLDWYLKYYLKDGPAKHQKEVSPDIREGYRLTLRERKRILTDHIFGVDIDAQAVEVTKLSMHLKVLEGETRDTVELELKLGERALPDLGRNIKCGNSLIATDILNMTFPPASAGGHKGGSGSASPRSMGGIKGGAGAKGERTLSDDEISRINPFDWKKEFPAIFQDGGFDAVIGNPPYALIGSDRPDEQQYYRSGKYELSAYKTNLYVLFIEQGLKLLRKDGAKLGYIVPKSLTFNTYFKTTRNRLLEIYAIPEIVEIRERVFAKAEVGDSILFFAQRKSPPIDGSLTYRIVTNVTDGSRVLREHHSLQKELLADPERRFYLDTIGSSVKTLPLSEVFIVSNGLNPGNVRHKLFSRKKETRSHKRLALGRDVQRYGIQWSGTWVKYDPRLKEILSVRDTKSKKGMTAQKRVDFALRTPEIFESPKILVRKTSDHIIAALDEDGLYFDSLVHGIQQKTTSRESLGYLLGVLCSKYMGHVHAGLSMNTGKVFAKVLLENLQKLPIRVINFSDKKDKSRHDKMVKLVERMLKLRQDLKAEWVGPNQEKIERQIKATDEEIDRLVYELYGLTEDEIRIVESP